MVSTTGFGFFSDFARIYGWAGEMWNGTYVGIYPYPLMVLLAPLSRLPLNPLADVCLAMMLVALVLALKRQSLYWIFFVPVLQTLFLGQFDIFFWLAYRLNRPSVWALLTLKPQLLVPVLPRIFASRRNFLEFVAASAVLHVPFLLIRPSWPIEWIRFLAGFEQNRFTRMISATASGAILTPALGIPFAAALVVLFLLRRRNTEALLFLANPALLPYDYSLLTGRISRVIIPLSWLALWAAWQVQAGWPYALLLLAVLTFETVRERRTTSGSSVQ